MDKKGGIQLIDTFVYSGKEFLDKRKECQSLQELMATDETSIPNGFCKYVRDNDTWYKYHSGNKIHEDTGRWRAVYTGREMLNDEFIYGIVDSKGNLLFGIRYDGSVYQPKGIPEEIRERFEELSCIQETENCPYIFGIVDCLGNLLFGIDRYGKIFIQNGITLDGKQSGIDFMNDQNFLFAILDAAGNMLFGIKHNGEVVFDKGIPNEVKKRLKELDGIQMMSNEDFIYAITDNQNRLLFGIRWDGTFFAPKGIMEIISWDEYLHKPRNDNVLYVIQGTDGSLQGAFINGNPLTSGEEYAFFRQDNILMYHGKMSILPKFWIDHDNMELMVDYPSNYSGPVFINEDGMLFAV